MTNEELRSLTFQDELIILRPISYEDWELYHHVSAQHSIVYRHVCQFSEDGGKKMFKEIMSPNRFFCIIINRSLDKPIGFIGIKDLDRDIWEIGIEIDDAYVHHGYGSRSLRLFMNGVFRITGHDAFCARVDTDNIPSQKCMEKSGGKLIGLHRGIFLRTEDEIKRFEEQYSCYIDDNIKALAKRIGVEPKKLLSHVLDYRFTCPL